MESDPPPPIRTGLPWVPILGGLLAASVVGNVALLVRGPREVERHVTTVAQPAAPACPPPPMPETAPPCPACPVCETCTPPVAARTTAPSGNGHTQPHTPRPPPVDQARAAEGEGHLDHAATVGERDPVQVAAQRRVADGVDRIVESRSPASAERFLRRHLPGLASMDCAFRDPASAEHVRMRLRELNALARPEARLSDADLARFERELRCPRE